tara:strand:+ start:8261 stop:8707 length:447 start_codon:yes stop_codon:yes gene_type:complete
MVNKISFKSKFGWITVIEDKKKILLISFGRSKNAGNLIYLKKFKKKILNFFSKKTKIIKSNILLKGSNLQIKIWRELQKIPYGETKSYGDIAKKVNTSPRYVGNVCGQNQHLIVIPCHRVIRSDGTLGGFSGAGGLNLKKRLINFEKS